MKKNMNEAAGSAAKTDGKTNRFLGFLRSNAFFAGVGVVLAFLTWMLIGF